jgi:hypothetical protein
MSTVNTVVLSENQSNTIPQRGMEIIPHTVRDFGVEARKAGKAWEAAFNGPIQSWAEDETGQTLYGVTVRLSRLKDPMTRELFSTNLLFYLPESEMRGMHNVYEMAQCFPFTRIRGPRTSVPLCPARDGKLWYDANPEGVIMEDLRLTPATLPEGRPGFYVTGQGYRGKVMFPGGRFIHDVGVYGGYLDPQARPGQLELQHLFGGIEFNPHWATGDEEKLLAELGDGVWVKGISGTVSEEMHVESYKNSVKLPCLDGRRTLIGARSMSETKQIAYFESLSADGLSGFRLGGLIDGLHAALGLEIWDRVHRVGLGSNFVACPELDGYIGLIHVVLEKNNPAFPETLDAQHPGINEQYEGWVVWLTFDADGKPVIKACVRAITPDDVPLGYEGAGELFDTKRVAFPMSLYRIGECLSVGYGWGDRALFQADFDYGTVTAQLSRHGQN